MIINALNYKYYSKDYPYIYSTLTQKEKESILLKKSGTFILERDKKSPIIFHLIYSRKSFLRELESLEEVLAQYYILKRLDILRERKISTEKLKYELDTLKDLVLFKSGIMVPWSKKMGEPPKDKDGNEMWTRKACHNAKLLSIIENFDNGETLGSNYRNVVNALDDKIYNFEEKLGKLEGVRDRTWSLCCAINEFVRYKPNMKTNQNYDEFTKSSDKLNIKKRKIVYLK